MLRAVESRTGDSASGEEDTMEVTVTTREPAGERTWARDMSHGIGMAFAIEDERGEEAARVWFHDHEQLPLHTTRECPMRSVVTRVA